MKKNILKSLLLFICAFFVVTSVNAETASYGYKNVAYCYNKDGSYGATKTANVISAGEIYDGCDGYYKGTIVKTINGETAYCAQANLVMSVGKTCTSIDSYNQFSWMNGRWTEDNAIRMGYIAQYIKSQNYGSAVENVYIHNAINNELQFTYSLPVRSLVSDINTAVANGNKQAEALKNGSKNLDNAISASFENSTLTNVNDSYFTGVVNLKINNTTSSGKVNVTGTCSNCTIYTDSSYSTKLTTLSVDASKSATVKLYVKTNGVLDANTKVDVSFTASHDDITYPIGKLWNCGNGKQSVMTLSSKKISFENKTVSLSANVPAIKKICKAENNKYYGNDGKEVSYDEYKTQCLKVCKAENNKYYGNDGKEVSYDEYKTQCLKVCKVENNKYYGSDGKEVSYDKYKAQCLKVCKVENNKYYGSDGKEVTQDVYNQQCGVTVEVPNTSSNKGITNVVAGSLLSILGIGTIVFCKKRESE